MPARIYLLSGIKQLGMAMGTLEKQPRAKRPTECTPELSERICELIAAGGVLNKMCAADPSLPSAGTVQIWRRTYRDFAATYSIAIEQRGEGRADQIHDIVEEVRNGRIDPQSARVAIDGLRFLCSKEAPRQYGDKVELAGADGKGLIPPQRGLRDDVELARWIAHKLDVGARAAEKLAAEEIDAITRTEVTALVGAGYGKK